MTTSIQQTREAVKAVYPKISWYRKVDTMTDEQVVAVYMRLKLQNKVA